MESTQIGCGIGNCLANHSDFGVYVIVCQYYPW